MRSRLKRYRLENHLLPVRNHASDSRQAPRQPIDTTDLALAKSHPFSKNRSICAKMLQSNAPEAQLQIAKIAQKAPLLSNLWGNASV